MPSSIWTRIIDRGIALLFDVAEDGDEPNPAQRPRRRPTKRTRRPARSEERTIHRVRQKFTTSCGVAVVGMFARVSHDDAMRIMFPTPRRVYYTHYTDIKRALDHFGVEHGGRFRRFDSWDEIPSTSLAKVKWKGENGRFFFHWVIFQRKADGGWRVLDPDPAGQGTQSLSKAELSRYIPLTYLTVNPVPPRRKREAKAKTSAAR